MIAIVIMLILSSIIGGVINDHITFYGSPWSVKMQKKKAYLIVFVILWVGMSSIQMFQDAENDGTKKKTEQSQETQNDDSDYSDLEDDIGWSYDDTDADYGDTEADYDDQDEEYDDSEDAEASSGVVPKTSKIESVAASSSGVVLRLAMQRVRVTFETLNIAQPEEICLIMPHILEPQLTDLRTLSKDEPCSTR